VKKINPTILGPP